MYDNNDVYIGGLDANDKPNNYGKLIKANGNTQIGQFVNGKMHGKGVFFDINGGCFEGEFRDNALNGYAIYNKGNKTFKG